VFLLLTRGGASTNGCGGGCASSSPVNAVDAGASVQFLKSAGPPSGVDFRPPQPSRPVVFSQSRVRPTGPMYIYPISNNNQGAPAPAKSKMTLSQPRY